VTEPNSISPEMARLVNEQVDGQTFTTPDQVVKAALHLLVQYRQTEDTDLVMKLREGARQFADGDVDRFDDDGLREFFDSVKRRGRERLQARRA
jgi:Arc/MetJ-type ribon-helix-helix transcriptional regulator